MKQRLLFAFLIISSASFAQSRHQLQNQIQAYKDSVVLTANYPIPQDSLETLVEAYFVSNGWKLDPNTQRFSKILKTVNRRKEPVTVYRSGVSRVSHLGTCTSKRIVDIQVSSTDGTSNFEMDASSGYGHSYGDCNCQSHLTRLWSEPMEIELKRHLYVAVFGNWLEFPTELEQTIASFNETRSEKRKLIAGVDY